MKSKQIYLLLIIGLFISACTTIQPRRVTDELYQTPPSQIEQTYADAKEQMKMDTAKDHPSMQSAPLWMYERYPYHPYYHFDPFGYYYPFSFHRYALHPYYGMGFGFYPYYGSYWYSPLYAPYSYPSYGKIIPRQRKTSLLPYAARSSSTLQNHSRRIRKVAPTQNTRKMRTLINTHRVEKNRKSPAPKRYLRATDFLRSGNNQSRPPIRIRKANIPQRKHSLSPGSQFIRQRTPVIRNSKPVRIHAPIRSGSSSGRSRK